MVTLYWMYRLKFWVFEKFFWNVWNMKIFTICNFYSGLSDSSDLLMWPCLKNRNQSRVRMAFWRSRDAFLPNYLATPTYDGLSSDSVSSDTCRLSGKLRFFTFIWSIFSWFWFLESLVKSRFGLYTSHHQAWNIVEPDSGGMHPKNFDLRLVRGDGSESSAIIFNQSESDIRNSFET